MATANGSSSDKGSGAAGGGGSKIVALISIVNLVATLGMLAILFISFQRDKKRTSVEDITTQVTAEEAEANKSKAESEKGEKGEEGAKKKPPSNFGKMVTLDPFTVNLLTPGGVNPKFVRVNISLQLLNGDSEDEVTSKMPQIRNAIIDLFNSKKPADLADSEGREYIKEEIKNALDSFLINGKIKGVFFTSFSLAG